MQLTFLANRLPYCPCDCLQDDNYGTLKST